MSTGKPEVKGNVAAAATGLEGLLRRREYLAGEADRALAIFAEVYGELLQVQRAIGDVHFRDKNLPVHPPAWLSDAKTTEMIRDRINALTAPVSSGHAKSGIFGEARSSGSLAAAVRTQNEGLLH